MSSFGGIELPQWAGDLSEQVRLYTARLSKQEEGERAVVQADGTRLLREASVLHTLGKRAAKVEGISLIEQQLRQRIITLAHDYMQYELLRLSMVTGENLKIGNLRSNGGMVVPAS